MKLLFDHSVSPSLVRHLADLFPGSDHLYSLHLHEEDDSIVWAYAREHNFVVVSKHAGFSELSIFHGFPPKLLWLRVGNCRTEDIESMIRSNHAAIVQLDQDDERGILSLLARNES